MAVPTNKEALLKDIDKAFSALLKKLDTIPADQAYLKNLEGHAKGTRMSIADLVSYLIGWGEQVLYWHLQESQNKEIDFPAAGFKWNELGLLAQKFYKDYAHIKNFEILKKQLEENNLQIMNLVESFSDTELYHQEWYGKWTRGRMIQFNTSSPYKNATGRISRRNKN